RVAARGCAARHGARRPCGGDRRHRETAGGAAAVLGAPPRDRRRHGDRRHVAASGLRWRSRPPARACLSHPQHRVFDGPVDLLSGQFGRTTITRISADDLRNRSPRNDAVRALSAVDQVALWGPDDDVLGLGSGRGDAARTWRSLAGDTDIHWATEHRAEIQAAARLRQHIAALRSLSSSAPDLSDDDAVALAQSIVSQLTAATNAKGTRPPVLLDETFDQLQPAVLPLLLELLPGLVGDLQVMLLTDDEAIASWARLEALAGELALVEPALAAD